MKTNEICNLNGLRLHRLHAFPYIIPLVLFTQKALFPLLLLFFLLFFIKENVTGVTGVTKVLKKQAFERLHDTCNQVKPM